MNRSLTDSPTPISPSMNDSTEPMCRRITFLFAQELPFSIQLQQADQPMSTHIIQEDACNTTLPPMTTKIPPVAQP